MPRPVDNSSSSLSSLMAKTGVGGLVSGLNTDELVESMTAGTTAKVTKEEQNLQLLEWKQNAYRGVSKIFKEFQSKYMDILSPTDFRRASLFNTTVANTASTKITATATSAAASGAITIDSISQLATSQKLTSNGGVSPVLGGDLTLDGTTEEYQNLATSLEGKSFMMAIDGQVRTLSFNSDFTSQVSDAASFKSAMQEKIDGVFGKRSGTDSLIEVDLSGEKLSFSASGSKLQVMALNGDVDTLTKLGLSDGQSDKMSLTAKLENQPNKEALIGDSFNFKINQVEFSFSKTDNLATIMNRINASSAGVNLSYSSIDDQFSLTSNKSGAFNSMEIVQTEGNLLDVFGLTESSGVINEAGQNAILKVNGTEIVRTSNAFEVEGVNVKLLDKSQVGDDPITINLDRDASALTETVTTFVEDYNTMITTINKMIKEERHSDYPPLTEAQKADMTEKQIEKWEEKAKSGLLKNDNQIRGITASMQSLMYASAVPGGLTLFSLGIQSAGYGENGKLTIDKDKLETALSNNPGGVQELFTNAETGLANRMDTIIKNATKTSGPRGTRGSLIELAGYDDTTSSEENSIQEKMKLSNESIAQLKRLLKTEQTRLWGKFTTLETTLQRLNVQSSMIMSFGETGA